MQGLQLAKVLIQLRSLVDPGLYGRYLLSFEFAAHRHARLHATLNHLHQPAFLALAWNNGLTVAVHLSLAIRNR